ncbi:MAG: undecaprenyl-diphosphate phosphatase [Opitutales bacterium]|nr:undecaprenyl-diphosphate phosphatase [Opitutales bacterium]
MKSFLTALALFASSVVPLHCQEETSPRETLNHTDAIILGAVEGATEYLPVSSTGHLILTNRLLGLDSEEPLSNKEGATLTNDEGAPITLKSASDSYSIIIQIGAILAVLIIYRESIKKILLGLLGKNKEGQLLGRNLIIAFFPAAALGPVLDDTIERLLFGTTPVAIALIAGSGLIFFIERYRKNTEHSATGPELHELSIKQCLIIGLLQCVAMCPGTSRSLMTISGGILIGLNSKKAAEFSFLLGLITLTAAAGYKMVFSGREMFQVLTPGPVVLGILIAWITAAISVKWLVNYLTKHGLALFAWYRVALAILIFAIFGL